jgi:hypothetical protein
MNSDSASSVSKDLEGMKKELSAINFMKQRTSVNSTFAQRNNKFPDIYGAEFFSNIPTTT